MLEVFPDNWAAVIFYCEYVIHQWRVGMNGPTGLDHTAVLADIRTLRLPRVEADKLYADIRAIERFALEVMREKD